MLLHDTVFQDLHYAARLLYRNARFTVVAVFALALGIGLNTTVFTLYRAMVVRPLDARDPTGIVNLALIRNSGATDFKFSYPDYLAYRDAAHSFHGLIAFSPEHMRLSDSGGNAESAFVFVVSENYFKVLGVPALRGPHLRLYDHSRAGLLALRPDQ